MPGPFTVSQVAAVLGCSAATVRRYADRHVAALPDFDGATPRTFTQADVDALSSLISAPATVEALQAPRKPETLLTLSDSLSTPESPTQPRTAARIADDGPGAAQLVRFTMAVETLAGSARSVVVALWLIGLALGVLAVAVVISLFR